MIDRLKEEQKRRADNDAATTEKIGRLQQILDELKAEEAKRNASENLSANEQDEMQQTVNSLLEEVSQLMREQQI